MIKNGNYSSQPEKGSDKHNQNITPEIRYGSVCPKCLKGTLDYNGLLNLVCPNCSFTAGGCFT